jgi:hypothetical protein
LCGNARAGLDAWLVEPSRKTPYCATFHVTYNFFKIEYDSRDRESNIRYGL